MPFSSRRFAVATELATAPSIRSLIVANSSMKKFAVDPVPTPIIVSGTTYLSAALATSIFISSWVIFCSMFSVQKDYTL